MKKPRVLLALVLTLILCLGAFAPTALADEYTAGAAITKILAVPVGTEVPAGIEFEFAITPVAWDSVPSNGTNMPTFDDVTLDLADLAATGTVLTDNPYTESGVIYYVLESDDFLAGIVGNWQGAGKYEYKITETADTYTLDSPGVADHKENMTWSKTEYTLYIYVEEVSGGGSFEIVGVGVLREIDDEGKTITGGEKVQIVTPGGDGATYDYSQIIFSNNYWLTPNGNIDNPNPTDAALTVSKEIGGAGITQDDYDTYFNFTLTLTPPSNVPAEDIPESYKAFVVDSTGAIVTDLSGYAGEGTVEDATIDYFAFVPGTATNFSLRHGESLIFIDTPVGTAYVVSEAATSFFQPNYTITTAGNPASPVNGNTNQGIKTETEYTGQGKGMDNNLAAFLNICEFNPDTGLQSLPVYGLSLLAVIALTAYVVAKSRKNKDAYGEN